MWVARDKDGKLWFYREKPRRVKDGGYWVLDDISDYECVLPEDLFPYLKWEDEPIEVELTIKK